VLHLGPWFEENWEQGPPTSFFLNLQTLFEDAVRQIVNEECAERVTKGVELKRPLLEELPGRYLVDPDVVVSAPGAIRLVMDCKYKDVEGLPAQPDVYQLSAHATALDCWRALLVYPGSDVAVRILGITRNGLEVRWATVRVHDLRKDLRTVLAECGVPLRAQPAGE
jgi:5-methylcytosine-specific restriction endonuclease McrBC regulatory subunit McrC